MTLARSAAPQSQMCVEISNKVGEMLSDIISCRVTTALDAMRCFVERELHRAESDECSLISKELPRSGHSMRC